MRTYPIASHACARGIAHPPPGGAGDHAATLRGVLARLRREAERIPHPPMDRQGDARSDPRVGRFNDDKELV
jgi:hypothetical protein